MKHLAIALLLALQLLPCRVVARQTMSAAPEHPDTYWINLHHTDDLNWAQQTKMQVADFQKLRRAAGISDEQELVRIARVDSTTLPDHRILLATASGNGHCLMVGVYDRRGKNFLERWSVQETPDGGGFCREPLCRNPDTTATKKGTVVISIPFRDKAEAEDCDHIRVFTYSADGDTYQLANQQITQAECDLDTYQEALQTEFYRTVGGERVVTLQVLPSFRHESAIVIDKTSDGLVVSRITFRKQLWSQLDLSTPGPRKTPSQCIRIAKAADVERKILPLPNGAAQRFVDELSKIDFAIDECPRGKDGRCRYVMDGRYYTLQFHGRPAIRLTDVSRLGDLRSENPALSNWISELLEELDRLP